MSIRFGSLLKELRIHLCQTNAQSAGVREFIQKNYVNIKKDNPNFPILIRECSGVQPRVWARYDEGIETCENLEGLKCSQVAEVFMKIANSEIKGKLLASV